MFTMKVGEENVFKICKTGNIELLKKYLQSLKGEDAETVRHTTFPP